MSVGLSVGQPAEDSPRPWGPGGETSAPLFLGLLWSMPSCLGSSLPFQPPAGSTLSQHVVTVSAVGSSV